MVNHTRDNTRDWAESIFNKRLDEEPWFGIEQEYFIFNGSDNLNISDSKPQGQYYCSMNKKILSKKYETSNFNNFTVSKANRSASIRIGNKTINDGFGYTKDRRPSSNIDPYLVTGKIFETMINL